MTNSNYRLADPIPLGVRLTPQVVRDRVRCALLPWLSRLIARVPGTTGKHLPIRPFAAAYTAPRRDPNPPLANDGMPGPPRELWHGYGETLERFLEIGADNFETLRAILEAAGRAIQPEHRILDFGCGAAPVLRNFREHAQRAEVWGVDISAEHVWWCRQCLGAPFRFATTSTAPHLPFEDRRFDLVYCLSVFSHMTEQVEAWLCELSRVIRPGGTLFLTFVPVEAMHRYLKEWPEIGFALDLRRHFDEATLKSADFDMLVCERIPQGHIVWDRDIFLSMCEQSFKVVREEPNAYSFQTALVLERV